MKDREQKEPKSALDDLMLWLAREGSKVPALAWVIVAVLFFGTVFALYSCLGVSP